MRKKRLINKKEYKLINQCCKICGNNDQTVLDVHRLQHGSDGGKYTAENSVVLCCLCHRLYHGGKIQIDKWYNSTDGRKLHWFDEKGKEYFT